MAKTDIGPKISVQGENEYRKQMKNIIQQQKEYNSELDAVTSSLGRNSTAQERASAVSAVLKKQIQAQQSALAIQNYMLDAAKKKYQDGSAEVSAYKVAVNKSTAELAKLKNRLADAENGLGEFADKSKETKEVLQEFSESTSKADFSGLEKFVAKGQIIASAFQTISKKAVDAGQKAIETGVTYNRQIEQYQVALTNMLGSEDQAIEVLNQIKADAARTPFDTAGLTKANQLLISAGVDAESSRQTILALGDAVSATGGGNEELSRMAQNLQQIKNAGKATSADIKQFAYAGIDVYGILADYTGKSTAEVQKMTVTYDLLTGALENAANAGGRYYQAMESQSQTINGRISTLQDNATQLAGALTTGITSGLGDVVEIANQWTIELKNSLEENGFSGMIETGNSLAGKAIEGFAEYVSNNSDKIVDSGLSIAGAFASGVVDNVPKIIGSAGTLIEAFGTKIVDSLPSIVENGGKIVGNLCDGILSGLGDVAKAGTNVLETFTERLFDKDIWVSTGKGINELIRGVFNGAQNFTNAILSDDVDKKIAEKAEERQSQLTQDAKNDLEQYDAMLDAIADKAEHNKQIVSNIVSQKITGGDTGGNTGGDSSGSSSSTQKAAADQKKLAKSVTDTSTKMLEGTGNIVGAIKQVTETADNTYNVYDGTTKKLKGTTTETAQTITRTWTEMVNGVQKNFKQVDTLLDGVVQKTQITSDAVNGTQTSNQTSTQKIYGMEGVMGAVDRSTQITRETEKVWNEATGEFEDKIIESGKKVTDSFVRMNNGIKESVTVTKTYVGGQLTDTQEQVQALNDEIVDVQGTVGGFTKFILDLDTKLGGLETVANNLSNSPLGNWFSDLTKGYRADDSFWDNINLVSLAGSAVSGGISGYQLTGSPYGAAAGAIIGVIGNLLGTAIDTDANTWGGDLVKSMAGGMEKAAPEIAAAASDIGKTISSFLHFSCPDVGPLTEYETWMPDMVEGMAEGIRKNAYKIRDAAADLSGQLQMQLQYDVGQTGAASQTTNNRTVRMGGVTVQVYAAPGQSAEEVADSVLERLQWKINQEAASIGEPLPVL